MQGEANGWTHPLTRSQIKGFNHAKPIQGTSYLILVNSYSK